MTASKPKRRAWSIVDYSKDHPLSWMNDLSAEDGISVSLRILQSRTGCATNTLKEVIETLKPYLRLASFSSFANADSKLKKASGATCLRLNGCVGCHHHVFHPQNRDRLCPKCHHPRLRQNGSAHEVCWYFPLRAKLEQLLQLPTFVKFLKHQLHRQKNPSFVADIFDAAYWKQLGGGDPFIIFLQYCIDGIPAFVSGGLSVKPCEFMILNLPPVLRTQTRNMLLHMLIPDHLKGQAARKYYDWAAHYEINDLHTNGVLGWRVVVYGTTLDSPGRADILQMQSHGAYYGCPCCEHMFDPGLKSKPVFGGYRRFLPARHRWRRSRTFQVRGCVYYFPDVDIRPPPKTRTTQTAAVYTQLATTRRPFRGHKDKPYLSRWRSFTWRMIICDIMHDLKCVCVMLLKVLVGQGPHGMYNVWNKEKRDLKHRDYCRVHNIFPQVHNGENPLPWRLSRADVDVVDTRVKSMWWPHYMDVLHKDGYSFWKKSSTMWKSRNKMMILMVCVFTN